MDRRARERVRLSAVIAVALAGAFVAWLALGGEDGQPPAVAAGKVRLAGEADVRELAETLAVPLHWAGRRPGFRYELTQTERGVFLRYLPRGAAAGDRRAAFLAVATYPQRDGFAAVQAGGRRPGAVSLRLPDGGLAVYDRSRPASVYFSHPGAGYQVEVFHPDGETARWLVVSGQVTTVTRPSRASPPAVLTPSQLRRLAAFVGVDVHWAGPRPGFRYEVTQTAARRVFVRYLPEGVTVGDPRPSYLTVATYAQADGFAAVRAGGRRPGAATLRLPRGGLAVFDRERPTSLYLAYPGARYQVEVYHPDGHVARRLAASGQIKPIG